MAWPPSSDIDQQYTDGTTDQPADARTEINKTLGYVNDIIDGRGQANGVASLDATSKVPASQLSVGGRGALVYLDANQSISSHVTTSYAINFDQESYDSDSVHDNATNNSRLTVPSGVTWCRVHAGLVFDGHATGFRMIEIRRNALSAYPGRPRQQVATADGTYLTYLNISSPPLQVTSANYFELYALQNSGGALDVFGNANGHLTWFAMEILV